MRRMLRIVAATLGVLVLLFVVLIAVNLIDQSPQPALIEAIAEPATTIPPDKNGYFHLVGLDAPADKLPNFWGQERIFTLEGTRKDLPVAGTLEFLGAPVVCDLDQMDCLETARTKRADLETWLAANTEMMARYEAAAAYENINETYRPRSFDSPAPSFNPVRQAQAGRFAKAALLAEDGDFAGALAILETEIALHRRLARGSKLITTKLASVALLSKDYLFISELMQRDGAKLAADRALMDRVERMIAPLNAQEQDLGASIRNEMREYTEMIKLLPELTASGKHPVGLLTEEPGVLDPQLAKILRPNATANLFYQKYQALEPVLRADAVHFIEERERYRRTVDALDDFGFGIVYNPIGKILSVTWSVDYSEYVKRVHDTTGLLRLVTLQAKIAGGRVADVDIPSFLLQSDTAMRDPYTGQPMEWDAAKRQLFFKSDVKSSWLSKKFGKGSGRLAVNL